MRVPILLLFAGYAAAQAVGPPAAVPTSSTPAAAPPASSSPRPVAPPASSSQNAPAQPTTPAAPSSSAAPTPTSFSGPPTFVFQNLATATQCAPVQVRWDLRNADRTKYTVDLYAFNIGVDQAIPPASSPSSAAPPANTPAAQPSANNNANSTPAANPAPAASAAAPASAAQPNPQPTPQASAPPTTQAVAGGNAAASPAKRDAHGLHAHRNPLLSADEYVHLVARADINSTIVKGWRAQASYAWTVNVPPGRYRLLAIVSDEARTWAESGPFTVVASSNTTCLQQDSSKTNSAAAGASSGSAAGSGDNAESKKSGLSGGAIAGVVIGVLAGLALAILAFICFRRAARDKRRDAGGREPQTPMRNLIGAPTDFRKTKGARSSVGHALAAIGIGANRGGDGIERAERGEKPMFAAVPPMNLGTRRGSNMTNETDNPFETAPTTPVEEKTPSHTPGSSFGTSIPPASALAAGAAAQADSNDPHRYPPRSPPRGAYDGIDDEPDTFRRSTPTPMRLPPSQLPANLVPSSVGTSPAGGTPSGTSPTTPVTPGFAPRATHQSRPSAGSAREAIPTATTPSVPPPSAFPVTPTSPGKVVERKSSTRRKPVPRLTDVDVESPSQGHSSESSHEATAGGIQLPESKPIGGGPAGDEYGLNAALAGIDRSQTYALVADPPLPQDDRH
ncbi:hypothetical protein CC85DRAFT_60943 [Cutaneotrichosporon oleaginosum]|uniref:Mid2 domain-containing protein n=1 Tax=Cutaneotrichosporon oleaginosum TaxID=879819 RepID=A0A0J1B6D6_9TREE|nr:uncharacterized protein CC85DRAFT_60943 [Cutaneotrichosporon oleaginosum]KLT43289.1 hypothetical protein CC85DRAFT_60943 [Cutaneotrichosporon oleaginosum]TXT14448.1 hypothetical protein COLE_00641 [Cutaneotrichosporon oleaginosum]